MTATAHALVGGAIAASIQNPAVGLTLAALSHPILDMIPHWDFGWGWRKKNKLLLFAQASFDLILGFVLAYILFGQHMNFWYFFAAVLVSEMWDIAEAPYWFFNWRFPPFSWIYEIQHRIQGKTSSVSMGILTQIGTVASLVLILRIVH